MESEPPPAVLRLEPAPVFALVSYLREPGRTTTAIAREWPEGARCQLCEACTASHGRCLVQVTAEVPRDLVPMFSLRDFHRGRGHDDLARSG
jgi:hypothetical protein